MTEPAWHPDPTGRNHYRWWDGSQWTDSVSNNGQVGVDPVQTQATPAQQAAPQQAAAAQPNASFSQAPSTGGAAPVPEAAVVPSSGSSAKSSPLKFIIPAVAAIAAAVVLFVVLGGGDDEGGGGAFGVTETELESRDSAVGFEYSLKRGDVIRVRAEPGDEDLDLELAFLADSATAADYGTEIEDVFGDIVTDFDEFLTDADEIFSDAELGELGSLVVVQSRDSGGDGDVETDFFVAFTEGTYTVLLASDDAESRGEVRLIVEKSPTAVPMDDFDGFSDFEEFFSDDEDFFSDGDFYSSEDPFTP